MNHRCEVLNEELSFTMHAVRAHSSTLIICMWAAAGATRSDHVPVKPDWSND
ncbi:hypothetical protein FOPG_12824 [Fusarium oxysporum f. sp. conglutinans race 2 54008]|uniref:Uncharacterized protein n=2 Tax=Fusarium oxysporum TaxID=5507 RepID=X0H5V7_FUSOX|nr:hypothetical protein FOVG_16443 [Fusarium oxysporum f. sp. pisi HDV247]EXL71438.1 hypothetical protein FOPG_12824 [Fusarium oxysporum f. sp. conglutinans race 2 54008]